VDTSPQGTGRVALAKPASGLCGGLAARISSPLARLAAGYPLPMPPVPA